MEDSGLLSFQPAESNTLESPDENSDHAEIEGEGNDYRIVRYFNRVFARHSRNVTVSPVTCSRRYNFLTRMSVCGHRNGGGALD